MAPWNLKAAQRERDAKERRMEKEGIVEEFLHEYHGGTKKSKGGDWNLTQILMSVTLLPLAIIVVFLSICMLIAPKQTDEFLTNAFSGQPVSYPSSYPSDEYDYFQTEAGVTPPAPTNNFYIVKLISDAAILPPMWAVADVSNTPSPEGFTMTTLSCQSGFVTNLSFPVSAGVTNVYLMTKDFSSVTIVPPSSAPGNLMVNCTGLPREIFVYSR
jgi:hypothetical protein